MQYLQGESRFYVPNPNGGKDIAEMTYTFIGQDLASIDHTFIDPAYRGQGIADKLFDLVIALLKKEHRKVIPICSYAAIQFERHAELQSMLKK